MTDLKDRLEEALNGFEEFGGNTPDFILAELLCDVITAFGKAVRVRDQFYGTEHAPGRTLIRDEGMVITRHTTPEGLERRAKIFSLRHEASEDEDFKLAQCCDVVLGFTRLDDIPELGFTRDECEQIVAKAISARVD